MVISERHRLSDHVVRCFEDENIVHVNGHIDPVDDIETINMELIFADLEVIEKAIAKVTKSLKADKNRPAT